MGHFSVGDWIALASLLLGFIAYLLRGFASRQKERKAEEERTEKERLANALREQAETSRTAQFNNHFEKLFKEVADGNERFRQHELECAKERARTTSAVEALADAGGKTERAVAQIQAQISRLAPGADTFVELIPARSRRRAGGN